MRLVINASRIGGVGGLRSFTEALAGCFENAAGVLAVVPEGIRLQSGVTQKTTPKLFGSSSQVSALRPILWWMFGATFFPTGSNINILCSTHHALPFRKRQIVTVHDIRPYYSPDNWVQHFNFRFLLPRQLKRCNGVLTVSGATKDLLVSVYGLDPNKVHVVPNCVDAEFYSPSTDQIPSEPPYLLSVGSNWKHKNVAELLNISRLWSSKYRLKIVAGIGQYRQSLMTLAAHNGIEDRVEFLTDVSAAKLRSLYQGSAALVYPSIMEGFGLPPLEAMSCGRPVMVSDIPVFRELYGDAPIFVQLGDVTSWDRAFAGLESLTSERLQRGVLHARKFSQERMKSCLFSALKEIWGETFMRVLEQ